MASHAVIWPLHVLYMFTVCPFLADLLVLVLKYLLSHMSPQPLPPSFAHIHLIEFSVNQVTICCALLDVIPACRRRLAQGKPSIIL